MTKATEIELNQKVRILEIQNNTIAKKLYTMGMLPNSTIQIIRKTHNNSTFFISINSKQNIAIRRNEAEHIIVDRIA